MSGRNAVAAVAVRATCAAGAVQAQVFEVQHRDAEAGGVEFKLLTGVALDDVAAGDERAAHEIALGYSLFDFWKTKAAPEVAWAEGDGYAVEAFEWVNVFPRAVRKPRARVALPFGLSEASPDAVASFNVELRF